MLTTANLFSKLEGVTEPWRFSSDSTSLAMMPFFHIAGSSWALLGLFNGCTTVVLRDVDHGAIVAAITAHRVTNVFMVPAVIRSLLETDADADFSSLRALVYGASPITDDILAKSRQTFGCELIQVYGMTETTGSITQLDAVDHQRPELLRSCGRPFPWVQIRIVDQTGRDVAPGTVGELWVRAEVNMAGYWNNPAATDATVTADGWLKTGDAGYVDAQGYLFLHDRIKDMIVSGGENVYPAEVENVLAAHPRVGDVAVIGVPDEKWGEAVKAVVVATGDTLTEHELIAFARGKLAGFKLPKSVDFVDVLPRNPSGKLLKRELREPYWSDSHRRIH